MKIEELGKAELKQRIREVRTAIDERIASGESREVKKLRREVKRMKRRTRTLAATKSAAPEVKAEPGAAPPAAS